MWSCPPRKGTEAARYDRGDRDTRRQRLTKHLTQTWGIWDNSRIYTKGIWEGVRESGP